MSTIIFNGEGYTAYIKHSESSPYVELEKGVVIDLPPAFEAGVYPWEPGIHRTLRIVPDVEEVLEIDSEPYLEWGRDFGGGFEWFVSGQSNPWDDNSAYVVTAGDSGGNVPIVSPYNRIYMVNAGIIEQFGNIAAFIPNDDGTYNQLLNNTDYIISLLNIPFKLPDEVARALAPIQLGKVDTEIEAPKVEVDIIRVPLGKIVVDDLLNNSIDYIATEYVLFLPYIAETIPLNPEWVIGKTISVEYLIDAYSGEMTVNVYNGGGVPIISVVSSIGRTIPFKTLVSNTTEIGRNSGAYNETFTAYIRKSRKKVYDREFSNLVSSEGDISEYSGYIEVDTINLKTNATSGENASIISILSGGVIIE